MSYALRGDHRIWYQVEGAGREPVLLIMGFGMSGTAWAPQVAALKARHRVACYDHQGVGKSDPLPRRPLRVRDLADEAYAVLEGLGWPRAHVVGVSLGGMIAQELALAYPKRIRSLSLIATHPGPFIQSLPSAQGLLTFLGANLVDGTARERLLLRLLFPEDYLKNSYEETKGLFTGQATRSSHWFTRLAHLSAVLLHDTRARLAELKGIPTLIFKPHLDLLIPARSSDLLAELIPGARLEEFPACGHGVNFQAADRVNALLLDHFERA